MIFSAKHENGTEWRLAVNGRRGSEYAIADAKNCARNYCRKNRISGTVMLTVEDTGEASMLIVNPDYTI